MTPASAAPSTCLTLNSSIKKMNTAEIPSKSDRIAVFSVGNSLMTDDGIAEAVLIEIEKKGVPEGVRLFNAAGDVLRIAQEAMNFETVIVIDAANMTLPPGTIRVFGAADAHFPHAPASLSNHGIGLAQVINMLKAMKLSEKLRLVCVQPFEINADPALSPQMADLVGDIAEAVTAEIQRII